MTAPRYCPTLQRRIGRQATGRHGGVIAIVVSVGLPLLALVSGPSPFGGISQTFSRPSGAIERVVVHPEPTPHRSSRV